MAKLLYMDHNDLFFFNRIISCIVFELIIIHDISSNIIDPLFFFKIKKKIYSGQQMLIKIKEPLWQKNIL